MHWFIDPIRYHYADFRGRASRKEYWMFMLMYMLFAFVLGLGGAPLVDIIAIEAVYLFWGLLFIGVVGITLPAIALQVRRLHDIGNSGWWYFIGFVPYVGGIILLIMSVLQSQPGTNKYGRNPYDIGEPAPESVPQPVSTPAPTGQE